MGLSLSEVVLHYILHVSNNGSDRTACLGDPCFLGIFHTEHTDARRIIVFLAEYLALAGLNFQAQLLDSKPGRIARANQKPIASIPRGPTNPKNWV